MKADHLVVAVNRIADFFAAMPEHDEAVNGVATHIARFWEPRMRRALLKLVDDGGGEELHPLVREVIAAGRVRLPA